MKSLYSYCQPRPKLPIPLRFACNTTHGKQRNAQTTVPKNRDLPISLCFGNKKYEGSRAQNKTILYYRSL